MKEEIYEEMEYINTHKIGIYKVLNFDNYKGYFYYILNLGTHPCTYIIIDKDHKLYGKTIEQLDETGINCHGGFTYAENILQSRQYSYVSKYDNKWVIGWDYGHAYDWSSLYSEELNQQLNNKKWTTEELKKEVQEVINQIIEYTEEIQ